MMWGPSKKWVQERDAARNRREEYWQHFLEKLSYMSEAEATNYLAQRHLAHSTKAGGFMVNAEGYMVHIDDVVRESRYVRSAREREEEYARSSAQKERDRAARATLAAEEREQEEARERSRQLRQRLRAEQGLPPEVDHALGEPRPRAATIAAPPQDSRSAWDLHVEREQAKQERIRARRAEEKEARRAAQDAKRGAMQRERTKAVSVLSRVLIRAMASAAEHGTDPAEQRLTAPER